MNLRFLILISLIAVVAFSEASAQYLYFDADGDGRNNGNETVPRNGWSEIGIWLDSVRNRDGSAGRLVSASRPQGVAEFSLVVQSSSPVQWGAFLPTSRGMRVVRGPLTDPRTCFIRVRCQPPLQPGRHRLGSIRLKAEWGSGAISVLPCAVIGELVGTSFQTPDGRKFRLGPTVSTRPTTTVIPGEWGDADAARYSEEPRGSAGPIRVDRGCLYLGWNRMKPPYELRIENGRLVVNGLALAPEKPRPLAPGRRGPGEPRALWPSDDYVFAVGRSLRRLGLSDSAALEGMAAAYRLSPAVDSVRVMGEHRLTVRRRGSGPGPEYSVSLPSGWEPRDRPWTAPNEAMEKRLDHWAQLLNKGATLQVYGSGRELITGDNDLERVIAALQRRERLTPADSATLGKIAHTKEEWAAIEHPVRLEKLQK